MMFMKRRQAERFKAGRHPQSEAEFLARCGFERGSTKAALAVVVRRVIGDCGSVDPAYVRDDDRWPEDLGSLDFWDSIDFLHFVFSVERATGIRFHRDEDIHDFFYSGFSVSGLARRVVHQLESASPEA